MISAPSIVWAHPDARLWVATGATASGQAHVGIVERVGAGFLAVDGFGRALGSFDRRGDAEAAVARGWTGRRGPVRDYPGTRGETVGER